MHACVMAVGTLGVFWWADPGTARASTLAFTTFVLFQVVSALNVRGEHRSLLHHQTLSNARLWLALVFIVGVQVAAVELPVLHGAFDTTSLRPSDWAVAAGVALLVAAAEEARLAVALRRRRPPEPATTTPLGSDEPQACSPGGDPQAGADMAPSRPPVETAVTT
jgi:Ca2+-transporting ATPase